MEFQTLTIVAGSTACNARCPFCISKMTLSLGVTPREPEVNWRNFKIACRLAERAGTTTVLITSKGEPTLFPAQLTRFLSEMEEFRFPLIELQTNGIRIAEDEEQFSPFLETWYRRGMTTIAISIVHWQPEKNREIYVPYKGSYIDLPKLIHFIHEHGFSVRLTCIMANEFVDSARRLRGLIEFAKENSVEQLTVTPVNKPDSEHSQNKEAWDWTNKHHLTDEQLESIVQYVKGKGTRLWTLVHGAEVYDFEGQNLCLNNCLTIQPESDSVRNLIFFPDGHLRTYWQYPGSTIL